MFRRVSAINFLGCSQRVSVLHFGMVVRGQRGTRYLEERGRGFFFLVDSSPAKLARMFSFVGQLEGEDDP